MRSPIPELHAWLPLVNFSPSHLHCISTPLSCEHHCRLLSCVGAQAHTCLAYMGRHWRLAEEGEARRKRALTRCCSLSEDGCGHGPHAANERPEVHVGQHVSLCSHLAGRQVVRHACD